MEYRKTNFSTIIGIHVRRSDLLKPSNIEFGYKSADADYIEKAIKFIAHRLHDKHLTLLLLGDDLAWNQNFSSYLKNVFDEFHIVALPPRSPAIDLCILTLCDHVIMTVGTFGWWAAYLSPGLKIYQLEQVTNASEISLGFNSGDYFPPDWIGL